MRIGNILLILVAIFFFFVGVCSCQVSVIHFNSEWNAENNFDITALKECDIDSVIICHNEELKEKHNIKSVPTIIVFDQGVEIARFEGNIMMELQATRKDIQKEIDRIYLAKFE